MPTAPQLPAPAWALLAGVGVGLVVLLAARRAWTSGAIDPRSSENVMNRGLTDTVRQLTGDTGWTLGGWVWEVTHPGQVEREQGRAAPPQPDPWAPELVIPIYGAM